MFQYLNATTLFTTSLCSENFTSVLFYKMAGGGGGGRALCRQVGREGLSELRERTEGASEGRVGKPFVYQ